MFDFWYTDSLFKPYCALFIFCKIRGLSQINLCFNFFHFLIEFLSFTNLLFQSRFHFHNGCFRICRRFDPGGSLDRRVNLSLHVLAQMGWREMEHKGENAARVTPCQGGVLVVGVTSVRERERERERESEPVHQLVLPRDPLA
jgi:hypothetical protein